MSEMILLLKIYLLGITGYFLFKNLEPYEAHSKKFNPIFYIIFSAIVLVNKSTNIIYLIFAGSFVATILRLFLKTVNPSISTRINPLWFGLLNVFDTFFLGKVIDNFVIQLTDTSILFFFIISSFLVAFHLAYRLRQHT